MRRLLIVTALGLAALPMTAPAQAAPSLPTGSCIATRGATTCGTLRVRCSAVVSVAVTVAGLGSGTAYCGNADASCSTKTAPACTAVGGGGGLGEMLGCTVSTTLDFAGPVAVCTAILSD